MKQAFSILNILFLLLSFMGFMPAAVKAEPLTNNIQIVKLSTAMPSRTEKPMVSAEQSDFNEDTGLYSLKGKVHITFSGRTITANSAKIKEPTLQLWTSGHTMLTEGELRFTGEALYAELAGTTAWFFGTRCSLERPGLIIRADNMNYNWQTHIVTFDGHVFCVQKGHDTAAAHLEFDLEKNAIVG